MKPYFSIIIPLYNKERHVKATIDSVLAQNFEDFEIVVVDDGSTDDSLKIVKSISDSRIKVFTIKNQGVSHARNYGTKHSLSDLVCFLDADDLWYKNHLEDLSLMYAQYANCGMYCKAYEKKINKRLHQCHFNGVDTNSSMVVLDDYFKATLIDSIANSSNIMIPKKIYESVGGFDESINSGEDTDMWIRIALSYNVCFYNKLSVTINHDADNRISQKHIRKRRIISLDKYEVYTKEHKSLAHYLDLNRFSLGMQSKINEESDIAQNYFKTINKAHLSTKQKLLMASPRFIVLLLGNLQNFLRRFNIDLSSYR